METYQDGSAVIISGAGVPDYHGMVTRYGEKVATDLTVRWNAYNAMTQGGRGIGANKVNAFALRVARQNGDETMVLAMILRKRGWALAQTVISQRKWQASVSRRPQRGRHHDSWAIREKYVRGVA